MKSLAIVSAICASYVYAMAVKVKFNLEMKFSSVQEKEAFKTRLSQVCDLLTPPGSSKPLDNLSLLSEMFEAVESRIQQEHTEHCVDRCTMSFMRHNSEVLCKCVRVYCLDVIFVHTCTLYV